MQEALSKCTEIPETNNYNASMSKLPSDMHNAIMK